MTSLPEQLPDRACLFLDVDGTLIDLAATPDSVVVPPGLLADLERAERVCGGALALVSGRSIAQLDRLFAPLRLNASGVHGAEIRLSGRLSEAQAGAEPLPDDIPAEVSALLADFPGTLSENKIFSYAVHYRATPESGPRLRKALDRLASARPGLGLQILPGHFVYELKRPAFDKGVAIRTLMARAPFATRTPIFIGDDVTDVPGFGAVASLGGRAYSVRAPFPDVSGTFPDPAAVRAWLGRVGREGARAA